MHHSNRFDEHHLLHNLKHYLPAQAPLKDFVHHNTLHEFQDKKFHDGIAISSKMLGYKVYLSLREYQDLYKKGMIKDEIILNVIRNIKGETETKKWFDLLMATKENPTLVKRIGALRAHWKEEYHFDLNGRVHVNLFRMLNSYLDQGVALWPFPIRHLTLLEAVRQLERDSYSGFFRTDRAKVLLHDPKVSIKELLQILVGDESLFEQYVFDQQFEHPGWSGLAAVVEEQPYTLLDERQIKLRDVIILELILEIDTLDHRFGEKWKPLVKTLKSKPKGLFSEMEIDQTDDLNRIWQESYEWTYYDEVLAGLQTIRPSQKGETEKKFQAFFCIDDREIALRQYIENLESNCETYSTPGHFAIDSYYQPENGKFYTKICPLPVTPKHLICEAETSGKQKKELHFNHRAHHLFGGWIIAQTLGFWSAFKLFLNVFRPTISPASASSFRHMDQFSTLSIENENLENKKNDLQIGYTISEMTDRVESVLKSTGLVDRFAPLIYIIGHGASSTNNTHFAAYDCGACSGRPGSVNARVFSAMANNQKVRGELSTRGINIPTSTKFIGGLHDTTRDDFQFYDVESLTEIQKINHQQNLKTFQMALADNAKERSRRFDTMNTKRQASLVHEKVKLRSVSLFEPRPEYNHATNSVCIVGSRKLTYNLFLDRRAFLNSYDYEIDPDGKFLLGILNAAAPVCGGINLEYYFSRTDNQKLGAGSKLPHNVMGLIGVANGIEGDLRPGLPQQMIEIHDPLRLLLIVEHLPEVVLKTIQVNPQTYEWFINDWIHLLVIHPKTKVYYHFSDGKFSEYMPLTKAIPECSDRPKLIESSSENLPVYTLKPATV